MFQFYESEPQIAEHLLLKLKRLYWSAPSGTIAVHLEYDCTV